MQAPERRTVRFVLIAGLVFFLTGCAGLTNSLNFSPTMEKTQVAYEKEGLKWGKDLKDRKISPSTNISDDYTKLVCNYVTQRDFEKIPTDEFFKKNNLTIEKIDPNLVYLLYGPAEYFNVHSELKESFKKGFRLGYEDRIADLVLGPHLTVTAACIGMNTSQNFVTVVNNFEDGWTDTLRKAVDTFIVLISEGSQADREKFIAYFESIYSSKWDDTEKKKRGGSMQQVTAGGTLLFIDMSKEGASAVMDIPRPEDLKKELYTQAFIVMGDEWGRRYATNLVRRDELVDLLRRVKPVLSETGSPRENLRIIQDAFNEQYRVDQGAIRSMISEAGIDVALLQAQPVAPHSAGSPSTGSGVKKK